MATNTFVMRNYTFSSAASSASLWSAEGKFTTARPVNLQVTRLQTPAFQSMLENPSTGD